MTMHLNTTNAEPRSSKGFTYVPLDIAVARDPALSMADKAVYGVICTHADIKTRIATLAVATIAAEASCSVRTVQNSTKKLTAHGVLACAKRFVDDRQVANSYQIIGCDAPRYQKPKQLEPLEDSPVPQEGADSAGDVENCAPETARNVEICTPGGAASAHKQEPGDNENQKKRENPSPPTPHEESEENGEEGEILKPEKPEHDTAGEWQNPGPKPEPDSGFCSAVLAAYHAILPELEPVSRLTSAHIREIEARIREDLARAELVWWETYFRSIRDYPYAMGKGPRGWKADFVWLIGERGMGKVLGGAFISASTTKGGSERGWEIQKRYTNEEGIVDARALLRENGQG